jgi:hypothetical protein
MCSHKKEAFMKKIFLLMLSVFAILPFAGQVSAATQEIKANDDTLAFFWGGRGFGFGWGSGCSGCCGGYYPYYGNSSCCGYGGYGYGGCGYSGCCGCY